MASFCRFINTPMTILIMVLIALLISSAHGSNTPGKATLSLSSVNLKIINKLDSRLRVTLYAGPNAVESIVDLGRGGSGITSISSTTPITPVGLLFEVDNVFYLNAESILEIVANSGPHEVVVSKPCPSGQGLVYKATTSGVSEACALPLVPE